MNREWTGGVGALPDQHRAQFEDPEVARPRYLVEQAEHRWKRRLARQVTRGHAFAQGAHLRSETDQGVRFVENHIPVFPQRFEQAIASRPVESRPFRELHDVRRAARIELADQRQSTGKRPDITVHGPSEHVRGANISQAPIESKLEVRKSLARTSRKGRRKEVTMVHSSFHLPAAICMALAISAAPAAAQTAGGTANLSGGKVKVGVLTDIAGPTAMANGKGSGIAAELAAEDFGAGLNGGVISADHGGKPHKGSRIAPPGWGADGGARTAGLHGTP